MKPTSLRPGDRVVRRLADGSASRHVLTFTEREPAMAFQPARPWFTSPTLIASDNPTGLCCVCDSDLSRHFERVTEVV